jgi:phosphatidylinositol-3-phosphatase
VRRVALGAVLAVLLLSACGASARTRAIPSFDHVLVLVLENKGQSQMLGSRSAPYFNSLARRYAVLSGYGGVAHPSLPNYLALVSGSTHGITSDCTSCLVSARNLADTIEASGRTWKGYAEGLPRPGFLGAFAGLYAKKHMPFLYFRDVLASRRRLHRVVSLAQLPRDLAAGTLPSFSLLVPDLCHDMHDCGVTTGDGWLRSFLPSLLRNPALADSVIFVVTDEPESSNPSASVPALALGPLVKPGSRFKSHTSHYGLLRTIEDSWGLPRLGQSARTRPITGIWK